MCNGKIAGCKSPPLLARNQVACEGEREREYNSPPGKSKFRTVRVNQCRSEWLSPTPQIRPSAYKWTAWRWDARWGRGAITPDVIIRFLSDRCRWVSERRTVACLMASRMEIWMEDRSPRRCGAGLLLAFLCKGVIRSERESARALVLWKRMTEGSSITGTVLLCFRVERVVRS